MAGDFSSAFKSWYEAKAENLDRRTFRALHVDCQVPSG